MRLKTKLVLAISALVFLIAGLVSLVYVHQLVKAAVQQTYDTNRMVADQVWFALQQALETGLRDRTVDPNNPAELRELVAETVQSDPDTASGDGFGESATRSTVYDINIGDSQGVTLLSTNPDNQGKPLPARPSYNQLLKASPFGMMMQVFGEPRVFDVVAPLENNGKLIATVNVGVHTSLLRAVYQPLLRKAFWLMGLALIVALLAAFLLSNLALRPLAEISRQLDRLTAAEGAPAQGECQGKAAKKQDVAARVSTKIEKIGQRMRNVEEVYSALRENLDQILGNLQDGILLFTEDKRAVLVSEAARRFLGIERDSILGRHAREIFDRSTLLGRTLREAIDAGVNMVKEEIRTESGRRIQASVDFIYDDETHRGSGRAGHAARSGIGGGDRVGAGAFAAHGGHRAAHIGRGPRGEKSHQRHRGAPGAVEGEAGRDGARRQAPGGTASGSDRRGDTAAGPRGADAGGLFASGGAATARAGSSPGHWRRAGSGGRRAGNAPCHVDQPHAGRNR